MTALFHRCAGIIVGFLGSCVASMASDGLWLTDGYGMLFDIQGARGQVYQLAGDVCVKATSKPKKIATILEGGKLLDQGDGTALITQIFEPHVIRATRLDTLPKACLSPTPDTPMGNFDALTAYFEKHYAFFDLFDADWGRITDNARRRVTPDMKPKALFDLFSDMVRPLRDGHIELSGTVGKKFRSFEPHPGRVYERYINSSAQSAFYDAVWDGNIGRRILQGRGKRGGDDDIQYGVVGGNVGYLALSGLSGLSRSGTPKKDLAALNKTLDDAMRLFEKQAVQRVIVDLSLNFGGYDFIARAVAERFAKEPAFAYSKYAADAQNPIRTNLTLTPYDGPQYTGPVYLLTSHVTLSAAEILTMSLRALPNVTHFGEPTRGALSDLLDKTLPNGWDVTLSNEVYLDHKDVHWEGRGIPPHVPMDVFPDGDPVAGHLAAVNALIGQR